ncbi:MAG: hypothetical protein HYU36_12715 [Planctomycetes bacterium]|nr:hypothetical protein [Planctomycetota bacterium]
MARHLASRVSILRIEASRETPHEIRCAHPARRFQNGKNAHPGHALRRGYSCGVSCGCSTGVSCGCSTGVSCGCS